MFFFEYGLFDSLRFFNFYNYFCFCKDVCSGRKNGCVYSDVIIVWKVDVGTGICFYVNLVFVWDKFLYVSWNYVYMIFVVFDFFRNVNDYFNFLD